MRNMFLPLKVALTTGKWFRETVYTSEAELVNVLGAVPNAGAYRNSWNMVYIMPNGLFLKFSIVPSTHARADKNKERRWEIKTETERESKVVSQYLSKLLRGF